MFETKDVDVNELMREVFDFLAVQASARNVALYLKESPEAVRIKGDSIQLQQVIINLIVNSMDAMAAIPYGRIVDRARGHERWKIGRHFHIRFRAAGFRRTSLPGSSTPSSRPRSKAWGSAFPLREASFWRTKDESGRRIRPKAERYSICHCRCRPAEGRNECLVSFMWSTTMHHFERRSSAG